MEMRKLVGSIDQGTSSTRFLVFDCATAEVVTYHQVEIKQFFPHQGWCDEDPQEILASTKECMDACVKNLINMKIDPQSIQTIGLTNQRETTLVWDKVTGEPLYNAIVWLDGRTAETSEMLIDSTPTRNKNYWRKQTGLPITTYFSAIKLRWMIDHVDKVKEAIQENRCMFGTVDTWLIWCLTGGSDGGIHATDVTNASRTMLMNLHTLNWDNDLVRFFGVEGVILPCIRSSSESFGKMVDGSLKGLSICGVLGDQQAALVGQACFKKGQAKNTYGTGCFLLYNTGTELINSNSGLLTTVAYRLGKDAPVVYALEGSVAISGACIRWLRDNLEIIKDSNESETLAATVEDTDGCYFVPAFTGLFCPYWQPDARGTICGLSQRTNKAHITRAALEAVCFQTREILDVMNKESGIPLTSLQVDGGMTGNNLLMQLQADLVGIPVVRPSMPETTALGAAMAAGLCAGCWKLDDEDSNTVTTDVFKPHIDELERDNRFSKWMEAVKRSMHWETSTSKQEVDAWSYAASGLFILTTLGLAFLANKFRKSY